MAKEIVLTQGKVALVDDEDYEELNKHKWCTQNIGHNFYAVRGIKANRKKKQLYMHREILKLKTNDSNVDHIDSDGLNNQRNNLRIATYSQNGMNQNKCKTNSSSKFKGVTWCKTYNKWLVRIYVNKKKYYLGYFNDEEEAAQAYNEAALEFFGEFARINEL